MIAEGYGRDNPYCSGVVELDEEPRLAGRIEGVDTTHPENIRIGTRVQAELPRPLGSALLFHAEHNEIKA